MTFSERTQKSRPHFTFPRWLLIFGASFMFVMGIVLLYLLTQATINQSMYERNYALLFKFNIAAAIILLVAILALAIRLFVRLRQKKFGNQLLIKLTLLFSLVGFLPGILIYTVSYQFVERSIETWFDVKVEGALKSGLHLGRSTIDDLSGDMSNKSRWLAQQISDGSMSNTEIHLNRWLEQLDVTDIAIWSNNSRLLASAGSSRFQLSPYTPNSSQISVARTYGSIAWVDGLDEDTTTPVDVNQVKLHALAYIPNTSFSLGASPHYVLITKNFPATLARNALAVEQANREYQERWLAREGLKRMYIGTLTLSLILAVFGAMFLAILIGHSMVRPLLLLAEGMSAVAAGDLRPKLVSSNKDELGTLTRDFASMTLQLADARAAIENGMTQIISARAQLQTILDNLTTGVLVLEPTGSIRSMNQGAAQLLTFNPNKVKGKKLSEIPSLAYFGKTIQVAFKEFIQESSQQETKVNYWQRTLELTDEASEHNPSIFDKKQTLMVRGAILPDTAWLLVLDDITEIISAQRAQAWGEVARRLAHEIKNPLTPIRLSAERLAMKLEGKLQGTDKTLLTKSTKTIVDQVDAMRHLVDEFRDYARLPEAKLVAIDLNTLIKDLSILYENSSKNPVCLDLDQTCPMALGDAEQLRQIVHNLVQNAEDASQTNITADKEYSPITIRTRYLKDNQQIRLSVLDCGTGFSDRLLQKAFEPYVTTKQKGTGLGLAVVKRIAEDHGTRVELANRMVDGKIIGAQVALSLTAIG